MISKENNTFFLLGVFTSTDFTIGGPLAGLHQSPLILYLFFQDPALRSPTPEIFSLLISQGSSIISIAQHPMIGKVLVISMGTS